MKKLNKSQAKQKIKEYVKYIDEHKESITLSEINTLCKLIDDLCIIIGSNYGYNICQKIYKISHKILEKENNSKYYTTVGKLINHLSQYDKNTPIYIDQYVSNWDGEGTDMSGFENKRIAEIYDLDSRIVLRSE